MLGFLPLVLTVALRVSVAPIFNVAALLFKETFVTLPVTTVTFTVAFFFLFLVEVTVILAVPFFLAVITPFFDTVATFLLEVL